MLAKTTHYLGILAGVAVLAILAWLASGTLADLWQVNNAGLALNRYIVSGDSSLPAHAERLEDELAGGEETKAVGTASFYRTYGFLAAQYPSEARYQALRSAHDEGLLDRYGELWLAEVAAATGHWAEAQESYRSVDAGNFLVSRAETASLEGEEATARNWYAAALASAEALERRQGSSPATVTCFARIAQGLAALGDLEQAKRVYEHTLAQSRATDLGVRERADIYFGLAQVLARLEPPDSMTIKEYRGRIATLAALGLSAYPGPWSLTKAAQTFLLINEPARAIQQLERAIEVDPEFTQAYLELGRVLEEDGLPSLARDLYAEGLQQKPGDAELLAAWAFAACKTMSPKDSLPILRQAIAGDGKDPYLFACLADALFSVGQVDESLATLRAGLKLFPGAEPLSTRVRTIQQCRNLRP